MQPQLQVQGLKRHNFRPLEELSHVITTALRVQDHILGNPATPVDPAEAITHATNQSLAVALIMQSVPDDIGAELDPDIFTYTPFDMCAIIENTSPLYPRGPRSPCRGGPCNTPQSWRFH